MDRWRWLTFGLLLAACRSAPVSPTPSPPALREGTTPIGRILADPAAFAGKEVLLLAYFRGWDLLQEAGTTPPVTRSDVVFADPTGALYADSHTMDVLPEASALRPTRLDDTETLFRLRARVQQTPAGQPYLVLLEGEAVAGLPRDTWLRIRRTGGIAGFDEELLALTDGTVRYLDRRRRCRATFPTEPAERDAVLRSLVGLPSGTLGTPIPDGFVYVLTWPEGGTFRTLTLYAETAPVTRPGLEVLNRWLAEGHARCAPGRR